MASAGAHNRDMRYVRRAFVWGPQRPRFWGAGVIAAALWLTAAMLLARRGPADPVARLRQLGGI